VSALRAALIAVVLSIAVARAAGAADAADSKLRVVIVIDESDDPFAERIKAEVSALGFEVVAIEPWRSGESVESLEAIGRANQAAAAIRMIPSRKGVEVWIADQPTGRSLMRQLIVDERAAPNEGLVALQTAELLRTTLLSRSEVAPKGPPPPTNVPPEKPPEAAPPPPRAGLPPGSIQAGAGALYSPGVDPALQLWFTVGFSVARPFGVALDVSAPLSAGKVTGPEGSAHLRTWLGGLSLFVRHERPDSQLYFLAAAGGALIHIGADATANAPLVGKSGSAIAGALYGRLDAGLEATRWLRVGVRGVVGLVPQGVQVRFAGNDAADWGLPFLSGLLVADLAW
jgi:hypothetical protein